MTGYADRSGTIASGGVAQQFMAARGSRQGVSVQNVSAGDLYINTVVDAVQTQPSLKLIPNAYYEAPDAKMCKGTWSIIGATTAQAFTAKEW